MGTRELIAEEDEIQPNGRVFKKVILGDYKWMTYNEAYDNVCRISSGLNAIGVQAKEYVIIFAETKAEWMLSAQACFMRNYPGMMNKCFYKKARLMISKFLFRIELSVFFLEKCM